MLRPLPWSPPPTYWTLKFQLNCCCPLWPETVAALREVVGRSRASKSGEDAGQVFLTKNGTRFVRANEKGTNIDGVAREFGMVLRALELAEDRQGFSTRVIALAGDKLKRSTEFYPLLLGTSPIRNGWGRDKHGPSQCARSCSNPNVQYLEPVCHQNVWPVR